MRDKKVTLPLTEQRISAAGFAAPIAVGEQADGGACLVDREGRRHPLVARTVVGREPRSDLAIWDDSVSRSHAEIVLDAGTKRWLVRDLGSTNGTLVDGERVRGDARCWLGDRQQVTFGEVPFVFVAPRRGVTLRIVALGAGDALVESDGASIRLGGAELAFLKMLAERRRNEADKPEMLRGFVRSDELAGLAPPSPTTPLLAAVRQLARRLQRALEPLGGLELLEARDRYGYRLLVTPALGQAR